MKQDFQVLEFLYKNDTESYSPAEISHFLKIGAPTVRRILQELFTYDAVEKEAVPDHRLRFRYCSNSLLIITWMMRMQREIKKLKKELNL